MSLSVLSLSFWNSNCVIYLECSWRGRRTLWFLRGLRCPFLYRTLLSHLLPSRGRLEVQPQRMLIINKTTAGFVHKEGIQYISTSYTSYTEAADFGGEIHSSWQLDGNMSQSFVSLQKAQTLKMRSAIKKCFSCLSVSVHLRVWPPSPWVRGCYGDRHNWEIAEGYPGTSQPALKTQMLQHVIVCQLKCVVSDWYQCV